MKRDQSKLIWSVAFDNVVDSDGYRVCEAGDNTFEIVHEHNLVLAARGEIFDDSNFIGAFQPFSNEEIKRLFVEWHQVNEWRHSTTFESLNVSESRYLFLMIRDTARLLATINQWAKLHTIEELIRSKGDQK